MQRRLNRSLDSSNDHKILALVNMKGFDPKKITVKDGKVKVFAKHSEEHSTKRGKVYSYRKIMVEMSLPEVVREDKVAYLLELNNITKIEVACKGSLVSWATEPQQGAVPRHSHSSAASLLPNGSRSASLTMH